MSEEEQKKVCFADIRAIKEKYRFCGKEVVSPEMLNSKLADAPIIVTTTRYLGEVGKYLIKLGVDVDRIYVNRIGYGG